MSNSRRVQKLLRVLDRIIHLDPAGDRERTRARLDQIERSLAVMQQSAHRNRQRTEDHLQAILRKLYLDPEELDFPRRLTAQRFRLLSQNQEDGLTLAILRQIGATNRRSVEIGSGRNGGNSGFLLAECGWNGLMIDGSAEKIAAVERALGGPNLTAINTWVTRESVDDLLRKHGFDGEIDLLSIDIDGNDYWVWEALTACSARLVIVEYNSQFGPERAVVVPYDPQFDRHRSTEAYYGASLAALDRLASRKGYRLIATEPRGVNAYFLRNDVGPEIPGCDVRTAFRWIASRNREPYAFGQRLAEPLVDVS